MTSYQLLLTILFIISNLICSIRISRAGGKYNGNFVVETKSHYPQDDAPVQVQAPRPRVSRLIDLPLATDKDNDMIEQAHAVPIADTIPNSREYQTRTYGVIGEDDELSKHAPVVVVAPQSTKSRSSNSCCSDDSICCSCCSCCFNCLSLLPANDPHYHHHTHTAINIKSDGVTLSQQHDPTIVDYAKCCCCCIDAIKSIDCPTSCNIDGDCARTLCSVTGEVARAGCHVLGAAGQVLSVAGDVCKLVGDCLSILDN